MTTKPSSKQAFTPGPWDIAICNGLIVIASKKMPTCVSDPVEGEIARWNGTYNKEAGYWEMDAEVEATARLIVEAPEMFKELKCLTEAVATLVGCDWIQRKMKDTKYVHHSIFDLVRKMDKAKAAIQAATGGEG